jgi:beta-lactamase class D
LPFYERNQEIVKTAMLMEDRPEYKLSYKTGWASWDSIHKKQIGWVVGWIEENRHPYFFVLNLESANKEFDMPGTRMRILKGILSQLGFMKGNK